MVRADRATVSEFVDLSHEFYVGMPGFRLSDEDGTPTEFTASVEPFRTHGETRPAFDGRASFEITETQFQTSVGTYLDAPAHRFPGRRDVGDLALPELIRDGTVVDVRGRDPYEAVGPSVLPDVASLDGKAVLFNFGRDEHWGTEAYRSRFSILCPPDKGGRHRRDARACLRGTPWIVERSHFSPDLVGLRAESQVIHSPISRGSGDRQPRPH